MGIEQCKGFLVLWRTFFMRCSLTQPLFLHVFLLLYFYTRHLQINHFKKVRLDLKEFFAALGKYSTKRKKM